MIEKKFEAHGLPCVITRDSQFGWLCGYVGVDSGHPLYGLTYFNSSPETSGAPIRQYLSVHNGVTFSGMAEKFGSYETSPWWFGYACSSIHDTPESCSLVFCENECADLAEQLARLSNLEGVEKAMIEKTCENCRNYQWVPGGDADLGEPDHFASDEKPVPTYNEAQTDGELIALKWALEYLKMGDASLGFLKYRIAAVEARRS